MNEKQFCPPAFSKSKALALAAGCLFFAVRGGAQSQAKPFRVEEATIQEIHAAYKSGRLTSHQLVQMYLDRINAYDKNGPKINSVITINSQALQEADRLDAAFKVAGFVGPLHGIPVMLKDMIDAKGMPTTQGSILFKNYYPEQDAFVVQRLKKAGAIILAKVTMAEFATGDTYGSLFGETRNPYDLERTVGGSSGGPAASVNANFAVVAVAQEGYASIRRPAAWNSVVGMRPTAGLVSRTGVVGGWPSEVGSLGPMARTVADMAVLLDLMVGYDPADPLTALGVGHVPTSYTRFLDKNGLRNARIGVIRESIGLGSDQGSQDFRDVNAIFSQAIADLKKAGAEVVDPVVIPDVNRLLALRAGPPGDGAAWKLYFGNNPTAPFKSAEEMRNSPDYQKVFPAARRRATIAAPGATFQTDGNHYYDYLVARQQLMINVLKVMADNRLDAIVYRSVEHTPTLISEGINPPYHNMKGAPHINTFLVYVPAITVPAGFSNNLPVGITFQGRPYEDGTMIKLAYAYEQATHHRKPPLLKTSALESKRASR